MTKRLLAICLMGTFVSFMKGARFASTELPRNEVAASNAAPRLEQLSGLRDRVSIRRDERGIPYIEAGNEEDLYFAQGYVTASDRLWQMDLLRRTVRGELSEIFGQRALSQDQLHRRFGFGKLIDSEASNLPTSARVVLEAYVRGVNAFIESRTDQNLPLEFVILRYRPRPWTLADSLASGKLLSEVLSSTWRVDIMRAAMVQLPKEKRDALLLETSPIDVLVIGNDGGALQKAKLNYLESFPASRQADSQLLAQVADYLQAEQSSFKLIGFASETPDLPQASNNWVVSGQRTISGKPLLANDPHLPAAAPGVWYLTDLTAPGIHVAGATFPGTAGVVLGHNDRIAWGATNLGPDVQDLYIEKFDKANPNRYLTPSGWRDAEVRHEEIKVRRNAADPATDTQTFDVTTTRHGPVILEKDGTRYALKWTALDPSSTEFLGLFEVNRARNWQEFTEALSHYRGPTQNFIYADVDGHIGYYGAGRIPMRKNGDGSLPYDGSTDDGEWTGFIPFDKLPHVYDPPSGMIVTANQRVVGHSYSYFLTHDWAQPYRARRIFDLLSEKPKLTTDDFRRIQGDVYSIAGVTFARAAAKALRGEDPAFTDEKLRSTIADFEKWDGLLNADSRVAPVVAQMRIAFRQRVLNAALGPELMKVYVWPNADVLIDRIISEQPAEWLPKEFKTYGDLLSASYEEARQALTKDIGADESQWTWGNMVKSRFPHPLAQVPIIGSQFTIAPYPQNGTGFLLGATVNVGGSVSMRLIADLSDWDKTQQGIPLGESGLPNSPHWSDQLADWRSVTPRAFPFSKAAVERAAKETVVLEPLK